jgi:putative ABC transport system ATP-binding protein
MEVCNMAVLAKSEKVTKAFHLGKTEVQALRGIDLEISSGEFAVLAGPSGSGKTTLLNLLGLIETLDSGRLEFAGRDVSAFSERQLNQIRRDQIGFVFQNFNLVPVLSAYENVEYPLLLLSLPARERRSRVEKYLERVGLWERRRHKPAQLSGGEQQRVAIARALVKQPALVIADEPTANLDSQTTSEVIGLMRQMNDEEQVTFVIASHDPIVIRAGKRVIRIRDGQIDGQDI